jgi:hypothetical protein
MLFLLFSADGAPAAADQPAGAPTFLVPLVSVRLTPLISVRLDPHP